MHGVCTGARHARPPRLALLPPAAGAQALFNERLAPEILAYEGDLVARVRERIEQQVGTCDGICPGAGGS